MQLSTNEQVLRQWDYATSKSGMVDLNKTQATLTITNKRIIHDVRNKLEISRTEVQVKDVKSVHMTQTRKSKVGPIMKIVLGIIIAIVGIIIASSAEVAALIPVFLILGGIFVVWGILSLRGGALTLNLYTYDTSEESLTIGASGGKGLGKKNKSKIKVIVNNDVAYDIVESLTALILYAKETPTAPANNAQK